MNCHSKHKKHIKRCAKNKKQLTQNTPYDNVSVEGVGRMSNNKSLDTKREYNVTKSNDLIQKTRYDLSVKEQKIMLRVIQMIQPTDTNFTTYEFSLKEFCNLCGIAIGGSGYAEIKKALLSLKSKAWFLRKPDGSETTVSWVLKADISQKHDFITIELDRDLKPYLLQLKEHFTTYSLYYTITMRSKYSIRLYELLKSYQNLGEKEFNVEDLKTKLMAEKNKRWQDFRRNVIETAVKEINTLSDIYVSYELKKTGRQFTDIMFKIRLKEDIKERTKAWSEIENRLNKPQVKGQMNMAMREIMPSEVQNA